MYALQRLCHCARPPARRYGVVVLTCPRTYATRARASGPPPIKLVAALRKRADVPLSKAREALAANNNDVDAALRWLESDLATAGFKKALKVGGRDASQGLIGVSVIAGSGSAGGEFGGVRAAIVEVNCETDFVARSDVFQKLVADVAFTTAFFSAQPSPQAPAPSLIAPKSVEDLNGAPLMDPRSSSPPRTVTNAIMETIAKVGEKITLRRAATLTFDRPPADLHLALRAPSYVHGAPPAPSDPALSTAHAQLGTVASLALVGLKSATPPADLLNDAAFLPDLATLERALARQVVGFDARSVRPPPPPAPQSEPTTVLYDQPFAMHAAAAAANLTVHAALSDFAASHPPLTGIDVVEFAKWSVGEALPDTAQDTQLDSVSGGSIVSDIMMWTAAGMLYDTVRGSPEPAGPADAQPGQDSPAPAAGSTDREIEMEPGSGAAAASETGEDSSLWNWLSDEDSDASSGGGSDGGDFFDF